jgi:AmiR/NasT family two-component response regulator
VKTLRVMVADDEFHARLLMREIVNALPGIVVGEVDNGGEVLEEYGRLLPDLLLLDINMPLKTGEVGQCIDSGALGYIRKDVSLGEMRERILDMLYHE